MTARPGRRFLRLIVALGMILATLWLAFPFWIDPVARLALAREGIDLVTFETGRPHLSSLAVDRLVLRSGDLRLAADDARLHWRPDGRLADLRVARLDVHVGASSDSGGDGPGTGDPAPSALPDPPALLRALPVERLELDRVDVTLASAALRFSGRLAASRSHARIDGTVASAALRDPVTVQGAFDGAGALQLRLDAPDGATLLDADLALTFDAGRLEADGRVDTGAGLLPGLFPDAPAVTGPLVTALRIAPGSSHVRILPGTRLVVRGTAPVFTARLEPAAPWELRWNDGRIESDGDPTLALTATLPRAEDADDLALEGSLHLTALRGTSTELRGSADGVFSVRVGARSAVGSFSLDAGLLSGRRLVLEAGAGLREVQLADPATGLRLEDLALHLEAPTTVDLTALRWADTTVAARARTLHLGAERLDLSALGASAVLSGGADAPGLRVDVEGGGLSLRARGALDAGAAHAEIERARASLRPGDLLPTILGRVFPDVELSAGSVELAGLRWPLARTVPVTMRVAGLSAATAQGRFEGADAKLELRVAEQGSTLLLEGGQLRRLDAGELSGEALTFSATGHLPGWHRAAAMTGSAPEALHLDTLELRARRLGTDTQHVDELVVTGALDLDAEGTTAVLKVTAPTLLVTVPAADAECGVDLDGGRLGLRDCGLSLLGGRVVIPAATIELATLTGYLPVALQGLDLGAVLLLMQDEALAGEGVLDGALPLRVADGVPTVEDGYVGARPPGGRLRYDADASLLQRLNQPGLSLAMAALGDFRYRELGAHVDYDREGTLGLRVRLAGASPRVENGRAIEFNLNVTQNLPLLLQTLRLSQTIGEAIERRLQERRAPR